MLSQLDCSRRNASSTRSVARLFLVVTCVLLAACASLTVKPANRTDPNEEGLRFYRPQPYLFVTQAKDKDTGAITLQASIVWLPDLTHPYVVKARPGFGSVAFTPTLENGWNLTSLSGQIDSKVPELITALAGIGLKLPGAAGAAVPAAVAPKLQPGIYALVFDEQTGLLKELVLKASF